MSERSSFFVRKLTANRVRRRQIDVFATAALSLLALTAIANSNSAVAEALRWHPTEAIAASAEAYLRDRVGRSAARTTVRAGNLDSRHRLAYCDKPLQPFLRRGSEIQARTIVGVRCAGSKPWKVYVPVDVMVTETVFLARRTLPRGHALSPDDLIAEQRDVSRLRSGYISDRRLLLGQRLKTQLLAGKVLTPGMLQADIAIRRGQSVTITVGSGSYAIRMSGKALMDGALNQRIRVENSQSGRVVEGIVRSREHVEVLFTQH